MLDKDLSTDLQTDVISAITDQAAINIIGGNSKAFYGHPMDSNIRTVDTKQHSGIVAYEPSELVVTVRAGTSLKELEQLLAENGQELPFEPPHFTDNSTIGGCIAAGLSGPQRFRAGAIRDSLLGVKIVNGKGQTLSFGGQVMKNVAGYDLSRLMAGAMGTLGLLLEVSLKLRARPSNTLTLQQKVTPDEARAMLKKWYQLPGILTATAYVDDVLSIRLSGSSKTLSVMQEQIGGDALTDNDHFWSDIRDHKHPLLKEASTLWRVAVLPMTPSFSTDGTILEEWGGGLRWVSSSLEECDHVREQAAAHGGHATLFRTTSETEISRFQQLPSTMMSLHQSLKTSLDPHGIFNPQRLFKEL